MKYLACKHWLAVLLLVLTQLPAIAEDIDLFVGATPSASSSAPNVLLIVDNTANWNSPFAAEKAALVDTFNNFSNGAFNVGLMMFTETGGDNSNTDGGYVRAAIRPMTTANKAKYSALISALDSGEDKSNGGKIGRAMQEAYLYYAGLAPSAGNNKDKTDYTSNIYTDAKKPGKDTNVDTLAASRAVWALPGNALVSKTSTTYLSPTAGASACVGKNYIIYISNGAAQDNASDIKTAENALTALSGDKTQIALNPTGSADNPADEWARFMKASSLGITVYTIDINKVTTGQGPGWTALLKSTAEVSGGRYFDVAGTTDEINNAINTILSEIQSVNSVFASVSLPVSVNTQGTYLNQVFIGMFRPDPESLPLWAGNLKQYKMGYIGTGTDLKLLDAASAGAINNTTGFIGECSRSFWTPTTTNAEWSGNVWPDSMTFCLPPAGSAATLYKYSDSPDGNIVEKGAQGYVLRKTTTARNVKTCGATMATCAKATDLVTLPKLTKPQLGDASMTDTEQNGINNWIKGLDAAGAVRLSAHGDVVHSRPVAVNFGSDALPNVAVFYGGNDGILRAVNGNQTTNLGTTGLVPGAELWSFVPPEFYGKFKRLYNNTGRISYPGAPAGGSPKDYGMDGPITAFKGTIDGVAKSFVYASMRRGGSSIYAFDVTNTITTPASPTLKWKIGCASTGSADCTTDMSGIGQTWSSPKSFTTAGYGSGASPLLIVGGGYDSCEDSDPHTCTSTSKGHYVYIINADTGGVVKTFDTGLNRGIIADATIVRDASGQAIYAYTADMAGNVYRLAFGTSSAADTSSSWAMTRIAALGCSTTAACATNRKFMFAPSVIKVDGNYAVMLGSGDREKPLSSYTSAAATSNYFFMFTDKPTIASATYPGNTDGCGSAIICLSSLYGIASGAATPTSTALATKKGWYLGLGSSEQVVTSSVTIFGVVTFSTHRPNTSINTCTANLGETRVYNVKYANAASANSTTDTNRSERLTGDGLPPSPVGGMVTVNGKLVPFCIGCSKDSSLESKQSTSTGSVTQPKGRTYWYIQK